MTRWCIITENEKEKRRVLCACQGKSTGPVQVVQVSRHVVYITHIILLLSFLISYRGSGKKTIKNLLTLLADAGHGLVRPPPSSRPLPQLWYLLYTCISWVRKLLYHHCCHISVYKANSWREADDTFSTCHPTALVAKVYNYYNRYYNL